MIVSLTYGQIGTPSENSDVSGFAGSPGGIASSSVFYGNPESTITSAGYQSPSTDQNIKRLAIQHFQTGQRGKFSPIPNYGPNK